MTANEGDEVLSPAEMVTHLVILNRQSRDSHWRASYATFAGSPPPHHSSGQEPVWEILGVEHYTIDPVT